MYPIEKYKFFIDKKKNMVIAASTYMGKTVRGIAKCDPRDTFDLEKGKKLAAARCGFKIAKKRLKRSEMKMADAQKQVDEVLKYYGDMKDYNIRATKEYYLYKESLEKSLLELD